MKRVLERWLNSVERGATAQVECRKRRRSGCPRCCAPGRRRIKSINQESEVSAVGWVGCVGCVALGRVGCVLCACRTFWMFWTCRTVLGMSGVLDLHVGRAGCDVSDVPRFRVPAETSTFHLQLECSHATVPLSCCRGVPSSCRRCAATCCAAMCCDCRGKFFESIESNPRI